MLATASTDQTLRFWDTAKGTELAALQGHTKSLNAATSYPTVIKVITASGDKTLRTWDAAAAASGRQSGPTLAAFMA